MAKVKLPQPYALRIEMMRAKGYAEQQILELLEKADADLLKEKVDAEANWEGFLAYVGENAQNVKAAVTEGYRFSFITIGGIKNLLSVRFHKADECDYRFGGSSIEGLKLSASEYEQLRDLVPATNWNMVQTGAGTDSDFVEIRIELANQLGG